MSSAKEVPAATARAVARKIVAELKPACDRIEVVGSLRRGKPSVHDIDIVLLPKGHSGPLLETVLSGLIERGSLTPVRGKDKIRSFVATKTGIPVDIYIATGETWATLLLIRTGSKEHNIKLARRALDLGMRLKASGEGIQGSDGALIKVTSEDDVFSLLGLGYLRPEERI
jgi:DNA polymerase/3'-5' exonuclease PolX